MPAQLLRERYPDGHAEAEVVEIVTAVAEALDYAHERDLLHRDVKPANILLAHPESGDQRILLADFGIARWVNDISGLTATNMTVGTVSYAAPEQLMGGQLDGRADQYALAATAFHLLTGSPPFQNSNPAVVISQHLSASPPAIGERRPELSALDPVLAKALAKEPKDRFERCADFARALAHRMGGAPTGDGRNHPRPRRDTAETLACCGPASSCPRCWRCCWSSQSPWRSWSFAVPTGRRRPTRDGEAADRHQPDVHAAAPPPPEPAQPATTTVSASPTPTPAAPPRGDRRQLLAGRQHGHDRRRVHRILLDAADQRHHRLVVATGRHPEPDGDDRTDRYAAAHRGGVANAGVYAADRDDPAAVLGGDPTQQRSSAAMKFAVIAPVAAGSPRIPNGCPPSPEHVEACGFESIVVVEHSVLMTEYTASTPTTSPAGSG